LGGKGADVQADDRSVTWSHSLKKLAMTGGKRPVRDPVSYLGWVLGFDIVPADSNWIWRAKQTMRDECVQDTEPQPGSDSTEVGIGSEQE
jgi:hypothetical protein